MTTREAIADKGRVLFNARGTGAVSLRDIAAGLDISYGNLTYHFPKKEDLVLHHYLAMMDAHRRISAGFDPGADLLRSVLLAPDATFGVSMEFLFLFRDFVEIMRDFPAVAAKQRETVAASKAAVKGIFAALREQGLFRADIDEAGIDHLMDLSGAMRTFFFMDRSAAELRPAQRPELRKRYVTFVNRLLFPYLTKKGAGRYRRMLEEVD